MNIDIKTPSGQLLLSTPINTGAKGYFQLMQHDYITLPFVLSEPTDFGLGSYVDLRGVFSDALGGKLAKTYHVTDLQTPTYNTSTEGYEYKLRLDAYYWLWKNKIFKYTPENAGQEASWSLTAALDVHLGVFLRNLTALGYTYSGEDFEFSIDSTVENKAVALTYDNTRLTDALSMMAEAWDCEWWVTDNVIHFGRLENGDAVELEIGVSAETMTRNESKGTYATRIYAFGSTRNIPTNYRPSSEQAVVNGVVQKRLMLPEGTPYIDAYPNMTRDQIVETVVVLDDVYPRRTGTLSDVQAVDRAVTGEDGGQVDTFKAYQYKDTGLTFDASYIIPDQELRIIFQSGKLNGLDFVVTFNPNNADPAEQLWEIVANEDYGRLLPDETIKPENGDTYILYGFDTMMVSDQYMSAAEQELKQEAEEYAAKTKIDDGTYTVPLYSSWVDADEVNRTFDAGQKVKLVNPAFFGTEGRVSRVIGWEMCLDIPHDRPVYTIGESAQYSRLGELEDKVDAITYGGQTYVGGGGGVYLIKTNDSTPASNSNAYSALRARQEFLSKTKVDQTNFLLKLLAGLEVGEAIDSFTAGRGIVADGNGRMQLDRLEVRNSMKVMEVIFNRLSAMESDYSFSESGVIESVTPESDGTYTLKLRQEWEGDFTALRENDIIYGMVNDLASGGSAYYTSWMRVLSVDTGGNVLSVALYPDSEVPGGKNYPPVELMIVTHRGNPVDEDRQSYWYISSSEKRIVMLDGVTKPILEEENYSVIAGKLPNMDIFTNIPDAYKYSTIYVRAIYAEMIRQIRFPEKLPRVENNRGQWSLSTAQGPDPYMSSVRTDTGAMMADLYDTVYHYGCKWACISDRTEEEPKYGSSGWAMVEGNPDFAVTLQSSEGWGGFDAATFETTLTVRGVLYNQDVTSGILDSDVSWSRDTGDVAEDNAWTAAHAGYGKTLHLTRNDLGPSYHSLTGCMFTVTALLRDGGGDLTSQDYFVVGD